jgi:flagellar operon protein
MSTIGKINTAGGAVETQPLAPGKSNIRPLNGPSFGELLNSQWPPSGAVHFSKHAQQRLQARNIELSVQDSAQLSRGIDLAAGKGVHDSLILLRDLALIVNVPSRTVVTAMSEDLMRDGVITNIDSAVLL